MLDQYLPKQENANRYHHHHKKGWRHIVPEEAMGNGWSMDTLNVVDKETQVKELFFSIEF